MKLAYGPTREIKSKCHGSFLSPFTRPENLCHSQDRVLVPSVGVRLSDQGATWGPALHLPASLRSADFLSTQQLVPPSPVEAQPSDTLSRCQSSSAFGTGQSLMPFYIRPTLPPGLPSVDHPALPSGFWLGLA